MGCGCVSGQQPGNAVYGIPVKQGFPLSTACERASIMGAIPEVIRYPGYTMTRGAVTTNKISNAGIANPASFWKPRKGCFYDKNAQLAGCNDCQ